MKKLIKPTFLLWLIIPVLFFSIPGCKNEPPPKPKPQPKPVEKVNPFENKVILKIENNPFTNKDFKRFINIQYPDVFKADLSNNKRLIIRMFDSFVEHKVLWFMANQADITVDDLEFNHYFNNRLTISSGNIDKKAAKEAIKVQKYLYHKVYDNVKVTEKEIRDYYNKNREEFQKKEQVLLYQILVKDKAEAVKIRGILNNYPRRFEEIARKDSKSQEAQNGGLMGYFEKGQLPSDMENVVFSLNQNAISPVVESAYGFHIFKVTKKKSARTLYLKNVEKEIEKKLLSEKLSRAYQDFLAKRKGELLIETFPDNVHIDKLPGQEKKIKNENPAGESGTANDTDSTDDSIDKTDDPANSTSGNNDNVEKSGNNEKIPTN